MTLFVALQDVVAVPGPELVPPVWRTVGALVVVLGLLFGLAYLFKKGLLTRRHVRGLSVEGALALGDRRSLVIVTVEGRRLLLGLGPGHVSLVTELQAAASFDEAVARATEAGAS
ncbi:MAG TPA: flagellar biosynthetic protein FliO [Vicinamibacterales bacterium]|nr:flagellar biosynthetic protein FliO [Vicinamibacterales bacterium]